MKKFKLIALLLVSVLLLTGCDLLPMNKSNNKPAKGNCSVFDCINKISTKDDLAKVTKIMGFDGEKTTEGTGYVIYKWVVNSEKNEAVQVQFYSGASSNYSNVSITFSDSDIKNPNVDFSKYEEVKKAMNNKEKLTYKDLKNNFKADGVLIEKTNYSTRYRWVNQKGGYINATFNNSTGYCTMIFGMIR